MPSWNDNNANLPDREAALRADLGGGPSNTLSQILTNGNDAGAKKIVNLATPTSANDAATKAYVDGNSGSGGLGLLTWSVSGTLTAQNGTSQTPMPTSGTITDVTIRAATAPTGASIIVDVNKNGTSIWTTQGAQPAIAAGTNASSPTVPSTTSFSAGDYFTVDIDQVGSTIAGADLVVVLRFG